MKRVFQKYLISLYLLLSHSACFAEEPPAGSTDFVRLSLYHTGEKGVGYKKPYSSLDFFISPDFKFCRPFLDIRGHAFNNGKLAFNGGGGVRFIYGERIFGFNAYGDYRKTEHRHYSQIGLGLESLGAFWDTRINGYLTIGRRKSPYFVSNNRLEREFTMQGLNAEIAAHAGYNCIQFYTAAGPYYFSGNGRDAVGGQARFQAILEEVISLEVIGTYDNTFGAIVQGRVGLFFPFPFGPFTQKGVSEDIYCGSVFEILQERIFQPVYRNEIIVIDKQRARL